MAAFDTDRGCLVMRLVYDGPALSGKTTNLQQVCEAFPVERRTELYTPGALKGRTMFFDWLEIDGGRAGAQRLRFQLLTVPGQKQRNYRRRPLVELADAVVFVCDSTPERLAETRFTWGRLAGYLARRPDVPVVVQANKQDHPGALSGGELLRLLGLSADTTVIAARACDGVGVKATLLAAMKSAMAAVQRTVGESGVASLKRKITTADGLFQAMLCLEERRDALLDERVAAGAVAAEEEADELLAREQILEERPTGSVINEPRADHAAESPPEPTPAATHSTSAPPPVESGCFPVGVRRRQWLARLSARQAMLVARRRRRAR